jgi:hypothetical protein
MASAEATRQIDIDAVIGSGDENRIVDVLDAIGRSHASSAERSCIMELASKTRSPQIRNAAAIALADLGVDGADQLLIDLIKRKESRGANGTLLYALREMNAYVPLPVLIDIITEDRTYEALEGVLDIIANNAAKYDAEEKAEAVSRMKSLLTSTDSHASHTAKLAIKYLSRRSGRRPPQR